MFLVSFIEPSYISQLASDVNDEIELYIIADLECFDFVIAGKINPFLIKLSYLDYKRRELKLRF